MKLTKEQIVDLFHFTERHYVEHYDVQIEIVDHLASAIETKLSNNPETSFDKALDEVYSSFGVMGLSGFIDTMTDKVTSQRRKYLFKEFKSYFTVPRIFLTAVFMIVLGLFFQEIESSEVKYYFIIPVLVMTLFNLVDFIRKGRRFNRKFIVWRQLSLLSLTGILIQLPNVLMGKGSFIVQAEYYKETMAVVTALIIVLYFSEWSVIQKVYLKIEQEYPEAFKKN